MPVPNTFANATATIPLSQLDANFATAITLGNTAIQLGNTVSTLNNMTLANVTVTSGNVTITNVTVTTANVTTANIATAQIANVTVSGTGTFAAGSNTTPSITTSGDTNTGIYFPAADTIAFTEGGAEAMRLDSSGRLLVGLTSTNTAFGGKLQVEGTGDAFASLVRYSSSAGGAPALYLARSKSATLGTNTIVASADTLGTLVFSGANGTGYSDAAYIQGFVDGTPGASADMPGRLVFSTSADGSATPTERMRIDSSGNLGLGVTPSAWTSTFKTIQLGGGASLSGRLGTASPNDELYLGANAYNDGTNWVYINTAAATQYYQDAGTHVWRYAASGTAGTAITFTQAMTLDASGNLLFGTSATSSDGIAIAAAGNFSVAEGSGNSYLNLFRQTQTAATILANGYKRSATNSAVASSIGTSWAKTAIGLGSGAAGAISFYTDTATTVANGTDVTPTERMRITSVGNVKIGGTADRATTEGTNQLVIFNGTAPVGTLTNGVSFYSAAGEARVMDAAGNSTLLSPHDQATNEWIFHSKHTPSGKVLRIDVEKMLRFINDHFGLDMIQEFTEE